MDVSWRILTKKLPGLWGTQASKDKDMGFWCLPPMDSESAEGMQGPLTKNVNLLGVTVCAWWSLQDQPNFEPVEACADYI